MTTQAPAKSIFWDWYIVNQWVTRVIRWRRRALAKRSLHSMQYMLAVRDFVVDRPESASSGDDRPWRASESRHGGVLPLAVFATDLTKGCWCRYAALRIHSTGVGEKGYTGQANQRPICTKSPAQLINWLTNLFTQCSVLSAFIASAFIFD